MIRKYRDQDLSGVMEVWRASSTQAHPFLEPEFQQKVDKAMSEIYLPQGKESTWVYEDSGHIVGFVAMHENEIGGLFVYPSSQSKGIGTRLVDHVSAMYEALEVEVFKKNKIGRSFYAKKGFNLLEEKYHEASKEYVLRLKKETLES